jgi:hypothetical protein
MERKTLRYPGDPDQTVYLMDGKEFRREIRGGAKGYLEIGPLMPGSLEMDPSATQRIEFDEIVCDTCNKEILDGDFLAMDRSRAVCQECYNEFCKPWILS